MHALSRIAFSIILLLIATTPVRLAAQDSKEATGAITGRVTIGGEAAAGIIVIATPNDSNPARAMEMMLGGGRAPKTVTDGDGVYRLSDVPAGRYKVTPFAPDLAPAADDDSSASGKTVSVAEGETIEGIDFALSPGGVITGRVTDADGRPMIGEYITLKRTQKSGPPQHFSSSERAKFFTDDRGIYRIYGLPAGDYIVSAGGEDKAALANPFLKRRNNPLTYFPGFADEARAKVIEVAAGAEVTGIDIKFGLPGAAYKASGRIVDAETGKAVPDLPVFYNRIQTSSDTREVNPGASPGFSSSNSKGEFLFDSLLPGHYTATANFIAESEYYSETLSFEVRNENVTGLEIKLHRGPTISGIAVIESSADPDAPDQIPQLILFAFVRESNGAMSGFGGFGRGTIKPDGSFRIVGLKPGRAQIIVNNFTGRSPVQLLRVERDGIEQREGIEVQAGEHISGVRLVLGKASGVVRGQVIIQGGELNKDERLQVTARGVGLNSPFGSPTVEVDTNRRFVIESLLPGDYELILSVSLAPQNANPQPGSPPPPNRRSEIPPVKQSVTVAAEAPTEVTLILDLSARDKKQ